MYKIVLTSQAVKDAKKIETHRLKLKVLSLLHIIENDPFISVTAVFFTRTRSQLTRTAFSLNRTLSRMIRAG